MYTCGMSEKSHNDREDNPPLRFELVQADDYGKYLLHAKKEIVFILRAMCDKGVLITVYFNQGNDFLLTTLLAVSADGGSMLLDPGSNAEMNRKALESDKLIFTAMHDKVKIQFTVKHLASTEFKGREAFRAAVPGELLRLQRREFYRLTTPVANPLRCVIPLRLADGSRTTIETTVVDISGGGLAVITPPPGGRRIRNRPPVRELPHRAAGSRHGAGHAARAQHLRVHPAQWREEQALGLPVHRLARPHADADPALHHPRRAGTQGQGNRHAVGRAPAPPPSRAD